LHRVKNHITVSVMEQMTLTETLRAEMEAAAARLGIEPSTLGERAGQGGRFYARLKDGKRVWPETAAKVRQWIADNATGAA
jgi:hypothetical protein